MGDGFSGVVIALLFLFFGIVTGVGIGERLAPRCVTRREYLAANLGAILAGGVGCAVVTLTPFSMLVALVIGLVAGTIAGLKLGFGESVGPWKAHDKYFRVNKDQLRRSENPERAEAVRRARRDGTPEPELMSVQTDGPASSGQGATKKGSKR